MPKKIESTALKVWRLVINIVRWILYILIALVLAYVAYKAWEYKDEYEKENEAKILKKEQAIKFEDFKKNLTTYIPLLVGNPSADLIRRDNGKFILSYMLGSDIEAFQEAFKESAPIVYVGNHVLGVGCKKSDCDESDAAFVVDPTASKVYLAMNLAGKLTYYGLEDGMPIPLAFEEWRGYPKAKTQ